MSPWRYCIAGVWVVLLAAACAEGHRISAEEGDAGSADAGSVRDAPGGPDAAVGEHDAGGGPATDEDAGTGTDAGGDAEADGSVCECDSCFDECAGTECVTSIAGSWTGAYDCTQGLTSLELELAGPSRTLEAIFRFSAHPENPDVPDGSFSMTGALDCDGRLVLEAGAWIEQPEDYEMVDLDGQLSGDETRIEGDVLVSGCTRFVVARE